MFEEEKACLPSTSKEQQPPPSIVDEEGVHDDLYGMQGLDSPVDVMKLESSPDIIPIVTIDDKPAAQQQQTPLKVERDLDLYQVPMLDTNIPFPKYDQYAFQNYPYDEEGEPIAGPSSATGPAVLPELMYQPHHQQPRSHPPPPYPVQLTSAPFGQVADDEGVVKVESEFATERQPSSLDLVLPPIANISPTCLLMNPDFQNLLSSAAAAVTSSASVASAALATSEGGDVSAATDESAGDGTAADSLFNFPTSGELLASLLSSSDPQTDSAPLPGFNQAFHQPP